MSITNKLGLIGLLLSQYKIGKDAIVIETPDEDLRRMSAHYIPYMEPFCYRDKGAAIDLKVPINVPFAFKDALPKMHTFSIRGVNIEAKDRKTAIKIYNHNHRS